MFGLQSLRRVVTAFVCKKVNEAFTAIVGQAAAAPRPANVDSTVGAAAEDNKHFDWVHGLIVHPLVVGDAVLGRWAHGHGNTQWFKGTITAVYADKNAALGATYDISYVDGDKEEKVDRRNIKGKESRAKTPQVYIVFTTRGVEARVEKRKAASTLPHAHKNQRLSHTAQKRRQDEEFELEAIVNMKQSGKHACAREMEGLRRTNLGV